MWTVGHSGAAVFGVGVADNVKETDESVLVGDQTGRIILDSLLLTVQKCP